MEGKSPQELEVDRNYEAFLRALPEIVESRRGRHALMRDGRIVDYFDSASDAATAGKLLFGGGVFSVQEVTDIPENLGFFSHALL